MKHPKSSIIFSAERSNALSEGGLSNYIKRLCPPALKQPYWWAREKLAAARLRSLSISQNDFVNEIKSAVTEGRGYAAAKIGASQKKWMYYEIFLSKHRGPEDIREYEKELRFHCLKQEGLFPDSLDFYLDYNRFYMQHVGNLDCLGLCYLPAAMENELVNHYNVRSRLIYYPFQEPSRTNESCYLPSFAGKRLLFICPFGELLAERATRETFEGVWAKTNKKWFYPESVSAVEFPYGFSPDTHKLFPTVFELFKYIQDKINRQNFDVALIAAGGLSIPLASYIKSLGKVGIDLGGHLQFVFGVIGQRWRTEENRTNHFNEWWIDMPQKYKPREPDVCDNGAYW